MQLQAVTPARACAPVAADRMWILATGSLVVLQFQDPRNAERVCAPQLQPCGLALPRHAIRVQAETLNPAWVPASLLLTTQASILYLWLP